MEKSIVQLKKEFAEIATKHQQIQDFYWGDFFEAYSGNMLRHCFLLVDCNEALPNKNTKAGNSYVDVRLTITICDKVYDDQRNYLDVKSDTLRIINDIRDTLESHRWKSWAPIQAMSSNTYFRQRGGDVVDGWVMTVVLRIKNDRALCAIPYEGYDFNEDLAPAALPGKIYRNGVFEQFLYADESFNYIIEENPATVRNSDNTYSNTVAPGGILVLPDIILTDTDSSQTQYPSAKNLSCTLIPNLTGAKLNNPETGLTHVQQNKILMVHPGFSGQTTIYVPDDDGDPQTGRGADFFTLDPDSPNPFGNFNRFTAIDGSQNVIGNGNLMLDWLWGIMWYRAVFSGLPWASAIPFAKAQNPGGYGGWGLPSIVEYTTLSCFEFGSAMNWAPLSVANSLWSKTTDKSTPANAWYYGVAGQGGSAPKVISVEFLIRRRFIYSDLGF